VADSRLGLGGFFFGFFVETLETLATLGYICIRKHRTSGNVGPTPQFGSATNIPPPRERTNNRSRAALPAGDSAHRSIRAAGAVPKRPWPLLQRDKVKHDLEEGVWGRHSESSDEVEEEAEEEEEEEGTSPPMGHLCGAFRGECFLNF
jgi:hypothetical protein